MKALTGIELILATGFLAQNYNYAICEEPLRQPSQEQLTNATARRLAVVQRAAAN